jgi:hypothetical protein
MKKKKRESEGNFGFRGFRGLQAYGPFVGWLHRMGQERRVWPLACVGFSPLL